MRCGTRCSCICVTFHGQVSGSIGPCDSLRGLLCAPCPQLLPSGVRVSIAYPPDTDTTGYANENQMKVYTRRMCLMEHCIQPCRLQMMCSDVRSILSMQPPECHAISRAAGDVLYTPQQVCAVSGCSLPRSMAAVSRLFMVPAHAIVHAFCPSKLMLLPPRPSRWRTPLCGAWSGAHTTCRGPILGRT